MYNNMCSLLQYHTEQSYCLPSFPYSTCSSLLSPQGTTDLFTVSIVLPFPEHPMIRIIQCVGFPGGSVVKNLPASARDTGSIPGWGRSPEGGNGNPLQYSCLENLHGQRSLVGYCPWGRKESDMTEHACTCLWLLLSLEGRNYDPVHTHTHAHMKINILQTIIYPS